MVRVSEALDSVPLMFMRSAYTKSCRYIYGYQIGLNDQQLKFSTKNYTSHCSIPPASMKDKELWELL